MTIIAIDGPGGAGKSTLAQELARRLGVEWLDTGAMYRAIALDGLRRGLDLGDGPRLGALAHEVELTVGSVVLLDGIDVTVAIRSSEVDTVVSRVAAHPQVRSELVERQRAWVKDRGSGVVEGRDIGTVVLPEADLKVYLTAEPDVRASRRAAERSGEDPGVIAAVASAMAKRDGSDATRTNAPLMKAADAVVIDTTARSIEEVADEVLGYLVRDR